MDKVFIGKKKEKWEKKYPAARLASILVTHCTGNRGEGNTRGGGARLESRPIPNHVMYSESERWGRSGYFL